MIQEVLLIDEDTIKSITNLSDNINGKVLRSAIYEAQEISLKEIIGSNMLNYIKAEVQANHTLPEVYVGMINKAQFFLAYNVMANICMIVNYKIDNIGVVTTNDDRVNNIEMDEVFQLQEFYKRKADYFGYELQLYILDNIEDLPQITEEQCYSIKATLNSAANTNIWLGGRRNNGWPKRLRYKYK